MKERDFNIEDYIPTKESLEKGYNNSESQKAWEEVKSQLHRKLVVTFLGTASAGKTSGIKALFNVDFGNIHPIPGSTTEVKVAPITENTYIVDAPGFGDIRKEISQKAKDVCEDTDIFIYDLCY
jgi:GTP-binding protein EngB required for normal cell division